MKHLNLPSELVPFLPEDRHVTVTVGKGIAHMTLKSGVSFEVKLGGEKSGDLKTGDKIVFDENGIALEVVPKKIKVTERKATGQTPMLGGKDRYL